ncbi:nitroreductase family protein [Hyphobacterium sp.]|uniref:nitroreductase family protein n=1 Tax=Hyphobacterium sp. TaxID=2004662 RepID=UPI003BAC8C10
MTEPGPTREEIDTLIGIASRVPDHGKLGPWRFLVFEGEVRQEISMFLADLWASENDSDDARQKIERTRFTRAPLVIAVVSTVTPDHKIPVWEQVLSAGAACQNLVLGAQAMGYASNWLTEWYCYHPKAQKKLGLSEHERVAGFIHIGSSEDEPVERVRPVPQVDRWNG